MSPPHPLLCAYCGHQPAGELCPRCGRSQQGIVWEIDTILTPSGGRVALAGAVAGLVGLPVAISWARSPLLWVPLVVALLALVLALRVNRKWLERALAARAWTFRDAGRSWWGHASTMAGSVVAAGGLTTERVVFPADGGEPLRSEALVAVGLARLLSSIDPRWMEANKLWFVPRSGQDQVREAALLLACSLLGMSARGEIAFFRSYSVGWQISDGQLPEEVRWDAPERSNLEVVLREASPRGGWLEREIGRILAEEGSRPGPEPDDYRQGPAAGGKAVLLQALVARLLAPAHSREKWPWLLEQVASRQPPGLQVEAAPVEAAVRQWFARHPDPAHLLTARLRGYLGVQGLVVDDGHEGATDGGPWRS